MKEPRKTAADLMDELRSNPDFVAQEQQREQQRVREIEEIRRSAKGVIADLVDIGFDVSSIAELPQKGMSYERAVPVLLKWLPAVSHPSVKEAIVRALSVPFANSAGPLLIEEFRRAAAGETALKWAIGGALEVVADDVVFEDLVQLVQDRSHGSAREMLVAALGNMSNPRAVDVLVELLDDGEVAGHAVMGLGKLKARTARAAIERFLEHPKPWVRKEAKKALASIGQSGLH